MKQRQHNDIEVKNSTRITTVLKKLFMTILYSSLFISFCGFALTIETYLLAGLPISLPMGAFVFMATLFTYNLSSVQAELARFIYGKKSGGKSWVMRNRKALSILGVLGIVTAIYIYFRFDLNLEIWFLLHLAIISIGYTVPILYRAKQARPLRKIPLLKVFLIAYVWAAVTIFFPLMDAGQDVWNALGMQLFLRRFLYILALALLFDIRDYTYDRSTSILTIPGLIGVQNTKLLSLGLLGIYSFLVFQTEAGATFIALLLGAAAAAIVVVFSAEYKKRIYYLLLADGVMLLHATLVYVANI
jgi:4-hydroxybenzoate polyprenyltransferase